MAEKQMVTAKGEERSKEGAEKGANRKEKVKWQRPVLEDVSGKVMAQPYIRFT